MLQLDGVIVGAGILGMLIGLEIEKEFPEFNLVILEKERFVGEHSSSRNSGVLHAGIYYPFHSLKRKLCIEGNRLWYKMGEEIGIDLKKCGKYLIAINEGEISLLEKLFNQAKENKVKNVSWVKKNEIEDLRRIINVKKAFFSKETGVVDPGQVIKSIEGLVFKKNIPLLKEHELLNIRLNKKNIIIETKDEVIETKFLINACGLDSVKIRKKIGLFDLEEYFVKGYYLKYLGNIPFTSLIYPLPEKKLKGLGIHTSFDSDGSFRFGPNAFEINEINYEMKDDNIKNKMIDTIFRIYKDIDEKKLQLDYSGIRSKIKKDGKYYDDFWIKGPRELGIPGYFELCGIDSPGFTASPAISKFLVRKIMDECLNP